MRKIYNDYTEEKYLGEHKKTELYNEQGLLQ